MKIESFLIALLLIALAYPGQAGEASAYELAKRGDQFIGIQSKGKLVQIRSEKSVASLTPNIWYIVYYDPDATFKATEVKFGAGEKLDVSRPWRILELVGSDHKILENSKLKIDSDRAIKIASEEPLLENLTLKATQLWLEQSDTGPQWKVKLWAARLRNPQSNIDVGTVIMSAEDGSILKLNLHPNRVD